MLRPRLDRTFVIAAERAVVDALGLEEYDGVIVLDRRDQQPLGVIGVRRDHRLHAADMRHDTFGRLAVRLATEDAAAERRAHRHRAYEVGRRTVAQDRKSTRLNSSHYCASRMPSSACKKKNIHKST